MKIYFYLFLSFYISTSAFSQKMIWNIPIHHNDIQLRLPKSTVLGKLDADIPSAGKVLVHFDGYITSSPGDRIIVAASNFDNWDTNERSLGLYVNNADNNSQSFSHQRVYNIEAGKHSFYAIGHNYVDTLGTGIASIHGTLTVEYFPSVSDSSIFNGRGFIKYPLILNTDAQTITTEKVEIPSKGKVLVTAVSSVYSLSNNEIEMALNNSEIWPENDFTSIINIVNTYATRYSNISKIFDVEPGSHEFFILARKNKGDFTNPNNAFYTNMSVHFFPDEDDNNIFGVDRMDSEKINFNTPLSLLSKTIFEAPHSGQVILNASGTLNVDNEKTVLFKITDQPVTEISDPDLKVQKLHTDHGDEYFSATKVFQVEKGLNEFYFYGAYDNSPSTFNEGTVSGNFTFKYMSDPKVSSVNQEESNKTVYSFFPNPTSDHLYINNNGSSLDKPFDIFIYDLNGNIVKKNINSYIESIEMSDLPDGVYVLKLVTDQQSISQKIIKKN